MDVIQFVRLSQVDLADIYIPVLVQACADRFCRLSVKECIPTLVGDADLLRVTNMKPLF